MPSITFNDVSSSYYNENTKLKVLALDHFSTTFENGKITAILGENGSGKTTLIKCICDFVKYEGEILLDDKNIDTLTTRKRNIGYVSQDIILNPKQNVFDNIAFSLFIQKKKAIEIRQKVYLLAELLKISHLLNRQVDELSKGQQQRVVIAKALIKDPDILLLDEPFSNLDKDNKEIIFALIKEFIKQENRLCIFVTHNTKDAVFYSDAIIEMKDGKLINKVNKNDKDFHLLTDIKDLKETSNA